MYRNLEGHFSDKHIFIHLSDLYYTTYDLKLFTCNYIIETNLKFLTSSFTIFLFQCQTAALDELFGNPHECFRRYQTAQILLHSLAQQSKNTRDKESLNKCKHWCDLWQNFFMRRFQ